MIRPHACRAALIFALQGLATARQRALLALLGILVGVAAVVALMTIGKGVEQQVLAEFQSMGTQVIQLTIDSGSELPGQQMRPRQRPESLLTFARSQPEVSLASSMQSLGCNKALLLSKHDDAPLSIVAVSPSIQEILGLQLAAGRFLHVLDGHAMWIVLGHRIHERLRTAGLPTALGDALALCGQTTYIAGVLAPGSVSNSTIYLDASETIFMSEPAAARLGAGFSGQSVVLRVRPDVSPVNYAAQLKRKVRDELGATVEILTAQKIIELRLRQAAIYTRFLTALSSISLLVGGLGILNVMLVTVAERRREIGLRMAVGADESDVVFQFLFESVLLALAGGVSGVVLGVLVASGILALTNLPLVVSITSIVLAMLLSLLVGTLAGAYPAWLASRQDPVIALQSV